MNVSNKTEEPSLLKREIPYPMNEKNSERKKIIEQIATKESSVLCREVLSIGDTMDVLRSK